MAQRIVTIEGFTPDEMLSIPDADLDAWVFSATPIVFRAGTAEVLGQFQVVNSRMTAELAHIDGGGEGVLPILTRVLRRIAQRRGLNEIEWLVYATNCAKPNPKLKRVLERSGYTVATDDRRGDLYRLVEGLSPNKSLERTREG
jgi:hypothetical protein